MSEDPGPQEEKARQPDRARVPEDLRPLATSAVRPLLQTVARMIATDRRAVVLATDQAQVLLANAPANQMALDSEALTTLFDWPASVERARAAGSVQLSGTRDGHPLEGELVHLPLGPADGYLLRLAESDHEAIWLRNRARSATLMRVAHDLRTPIQSLLAIAESNATRGSDDPGSADQMRRAAELALDHIDNVLNVIRGASSVAGLQPDEDFCVTEELRTLLAMVAPILRKRGAEMSVDLDPAQEVWLHGPVRFLRALFQNMIDNSAKYGGDRIDIRLTCETAPEPLIPGRQGARTTVTLEVRDQGGGLPADRKAQLNEALGQAGNIALPPVAHPTDRRPSAGLNVLAHALRQLGGEIAIFDRAPDGTEIEGAAPDGTPVLGTILRARFSLPAGVPPVAPQVQRPEHRPSPAGGPPPLAGLSLLIVEDSPSSRDWLVQVLRAAGARVHPAGNGMEALALLAREEIRSALDLVLTDMTLPYMNGFELAQRIGAARASGTLDWHGPVLGLTAHVDDRIRLACQKAGIVKVLEKPMRPAALRDAILEAVRGPTAPSETPAQAGAAPDADPAQSLAGPVVAELLDQFGAEGTRSFMTRARDEAAEVAEGLRRTGVQPDTGRRLHAATGASSLTGLTQLEQALRTLELAVERGDDDLTPLTEALETALRQTTEAIAALTRTPDAG